MSVLIDMNPCMPRRSLPLPAVRLPILTPTTLHPFTFPDSYLSLHDMSRHFLEACYNLSSAVTSLQKY